MPPDELCQRLDRLRTALRDAEREFGRPAGSVRLVAVGKTQPVARLRAVLACGQRALGENYAQEFHDKVAAIGRDGAEWHFIGPLQSNKTRLVASDAHWVHAIDRVKIARRLAEQRDPALPPLQVCLQVNLDAEPGKAGVAPDELPALAEAVAGLPRLRLRGLMCIPAPRRDFDDQRRSFARLRRLQEALQGQGHALDTLSMGMSGDFRAAIAEGATLVRIGTALFGPRRTT